jgi:hypothetical protein
LTVLPNAKISSRTLVISAKEQAMHRLQFTLCALFMAILAGVAFGQDRVGFLRFPSRDAYVELEGTRGLVDLGSSFTVEAWVRWDTSLLGNGHTMMGDEAWPDMSKEIPVTRPCGWVLRTTPVMDADKYAIEFNVGSSTKDKPKGAWLSIMSPPQRVADRSWHHLAISKSRTDLRLFWNGKWVAKQSCRGITLHAAPTNLFLGVRKDGAKDSSTRRYATDFKPPEKLVRDEATELLLDFTGSDDEKILDVSGKGRHGTIVEAEWMVEDEE